MAGLGLVAHGRKVGTTILGGLVVGSRGVPSETEEDGTVGAVIVVLILNDSSNGVVDFLVVEGLLGLLSGGSSNDLGKRRLYCS